MTIEEVAKKTDTSIKFIRREVASGSLVSSKINSKIYVSVEDYEDWYKNRANQQQRLFYNDFSFIKNGADVINWIDISKELASVDAWKNKKQLTKYNFIDLFSGAGGLSCGLVMAGFHPVGAVEILEPAVETYKYNFCTKKGFDEHLEARDITEENVKKDLIKSVAGKHIHLIAGGFPCQGFSMAGNRIVDDKRNKLYREMLNIVDRLKPDFVLMENVEGLRSMLNGAVEKKIIEDYKKIGYKINVTVLCAADYGVPQLRRRVIFIGNRLGKKNYHPKPVFKESEYKTVKDGIERFLTIPEDKSINHIFTKHSSDIRRRLEDLQEGESLYENYSDAWKKVYWDKPSVTVKENHGGVNVHPKLPRVMTPRELASLQSFPDDFIFKGTKKWQLVQIGNAVPPILGKAIGLAIIKSMKGRKKDGE